MQITRDELIQILKEEVQRTLNEINENKVLAKSSRRNSKNESRKSLKAIVAEQTRKALKSLIRESRNYYNYDTSFEYCAEDIPGLYEYLTQTLGLNIPSDEYFEVGIHYNVNVTPGEEPSMAGPGGPAETSFDFNVTYVDLGLPEELEKKVIEFIDTYIHSNKGYEEFEEKLEEDFQEQLDASLGAYENARDDWW